MGVCSTMLTVRTYICIIWPRSGPYFVSTYLPMVYAICTYVICVIFVNTLANSHSKLLKCFGNLRMPSFTDECIRRLPKHLSNFL